MGAEEPSLVTESGGGWRERREGLVSAVESPFVPESGGGRTGCGGLPVGAEELLAVPGPGPGVSERGERRIDAAEPLPGDIGERRIDVPQILTGREGAARTEEVVLLEDGDCRRLESEGSTGMCPVAGCEAASGEQPPSASYSYVHRQGDIGGDAACRAGKPLADGDDRSGDGNSPFDSVVADCAGVDMPVVDTAGSGVSPSSGRLSEPAATVFLPSVEDEQLLAWAYLSRVVQGPCAALSALIEQVGVVEAARAVRECELPGSLRGPTARRRESDCAERDLDIMAGLGGRIVTPDDPEWPAWRLLGLGQLDPGRDQDAAMPLVLWARGPLSLLDSSEQAVAVVGSRCSTGYGELVTAEFTSDLAARGWTIVSGAAFGIDATAHRAALAAGAPTIAVLACGVDRPYPAAHDRLLAEIAEVGLVVSEYPPGVVPRKEHFLARNRLIAALADGVLVIEAGLRSGARNTVKWARRLGRPALAVPGPVTSATSVGCHRMIREGEALLVSRAQEVIDKAGPLRLSLPGDSPPSPEDSLSGVEALIYAALPAVGSRLPMELAHQCDLDPASVRAVLAALDLAGLVGSDHSGWFRIARAGP